jgi:hypothetical protein
LSTSSYRPVSSFLGRYIEDFRQEILVHIDPELSPVVHLVFWHARMLAYLLNPSVKATDLMWTVRESTAILVSDGPIVSPFTHHCLVLTTLCLMSLKKVDKSRDEANKLLQDLLDSPASSVWETLVHDKIAQQLRPVAGQALVPSAAEAAASQGLQHLADLATASVAGTTADKASEQFAAHRILDNYEDVGFDPMPILIAGYVKTIRELESRLPR